MSSLPPSLIGVDGGGTRCRFALLHHGQRFEVQGGPANLHSDRTAAIATLHQGLAALAQSAGLALPDLAAFSAYLGLAGVLRPETAAEVLRQLPLQNAQLEDDRKIAVTGALGTQDGTVLGIGTGSFFARQTAGNITLIGGHGLVLGDEASGAYIGRRLLQLTLHSRDQLRPETDLTRRVMAHFNQSPAAIIDFAAQARPRDFAQFAPWLTDSAEDATARDILREGAAFISRALDALGWQPPERLCPVGGVAAAYRPYLDPRIAEAFSAPDGTALDGALTLAASLPSEPRP
ncbi:BadF/BadG/BcrA/BcrD ATPase family protein [Pararhodobacter oceanensis]|uniref:ATPase n=1 Tax=Pararhodobacter oceanensis TaxID=2172121 RepID=A0A2T8HS09_9RHOB|nr:BadF/BadG/BcrA/BcrD ATPase family protein [Pararhodobacter oceanensis]PVH28229.1 ATPase [Pararhodobacter oceanensis]